MFISSFWSKLLIWVLVSFPSLLVSCIFFFISLCIAFTFPLFCNYTQPFLWLFWLPVFWTLHLIGCLSLNHLVLFLEFWSVLSFGPYFFALAPLLGYKGWSLRYSPGWDNPLHCIVALYEGEGSEREQCHLPHFLSLPSLPTSGLCPFRCWFPGWVGLCMC